MRKAKKPQVPLSIPRNRHSPIKLLKQVVQHAGPGYLQFAITNACNAHCQFCNFAAGWLPKEHIRFVNLNDVRKVLDICRKMQIGYVLFVGGEPLTHPGLADMVAAAAERGIRPLICTNAALLDEDRAEQLANVGLSSVVISIDSDKAEVHERHRGLPGVCERIKRLNQLFKRLKIQTTASVTISRLITNYSSLVRFVTELGFSSLTFSYPLEYVGSSYLSFSKSPLITFTKEELIFQFEQIKQLHKTSPIPIVNPVASLEDMQRHVRGEPEQFTCLAGFKYFYLDWNLDLYRCHYWETPMCKIWELDQSKLIRDNCTRCMIDCYRDPSVLQFVAVSVHDAAQALAQGKVTAALEKILNRKFFVSLKANWQALRYTSRV